MENSKQLSITQPYMRKNNDYKQTTRQLRNKINHKCEQMECFTFTKQEFETYILSIGLT